MQENRTTYPIRIDKEGVWYYCDAEMVRKDIVKIFYEHLHRNDAGEYFIEMGREQCFIEVEDVPYVVKAVHKEDARNGTGGHFKLVLNDRSVEELDPASMRIEAANVPYCDVRQGLFRARFSRAAYYQIADHIEYDENRNAYYLNVNGNRFYLTDSEECHDKRQD